LAAKVEELFGMDTWVDTGYDEDTGIGAWLAVVAHQMGEGLVAWDIVLVALNERLNGGDLKRRHFGCGFDGLREEACGCSLHEVLRLLREK
jgi:hypothetical protein